MLVLELITSALSQSWAFVSCDWKRTYTQPARETSALFELKQVALRLLPSAYICIGAPEWCDEMVS